MSSSRATTRAELQRRLAEQVALKRAVRTGQARKIEQKAQDEMRRITTDERVTRSMVEAYLAAINKFPDSKIPNPIELLDDPTKAREMYDSVVYTLMQQCKQGGIEDAEAVRGILNNEYTRYLSLVLGIPAVPF